MQEKTAKKTKDTLSIIIVGCGKVGHTLTEQLGGLLCAGFEITDLYEDRDGGGLFDRYMNSYVAVRAIRK